MVAISAMQRISRRVTQLRRYVQTETQRTRKKLMKRLEEIFDLAASLAKGEVKYLTEGGVKAKVTMKQRQIWARVAAYTAQIISSIAEAIDEHEIDTMLSELEALIDEARSKAEAGEAKAGATEPAEDRG